MDQLEFPGFRYRKKYKPLAQPKCPCCHQKITKKAVRLTVWQNFRTWLLLNWDFVAKELLRRQVHHTPQVDLTEHPELLFALELDAGANNLELSDRVAEILDSYLQGEFNDIQRRGLKIPPDPEIEPLGDDIESSHGQQ